MSVSTITHCNYNTCHSLLPFSNDTPYCEHSTKYWTRATVTHVLYENVQSAKLRKHLVFTSRVSCSQTNPFFLSNSLLGESDNCTDSKNRKRGANETSHVALGVITPGNVQEEIQFSIISRCLIKAASKCKAPWLISVLIMATVK